MIITIGELSNVLLEYSNSIEMSIVREMPFMKALIAGSSGITKAYVYILQTSEHQYSVCDHYDDLSGNIYFPTGSIEHPFIQEKEIIGLKYKINGSNNNGEYSSVLTGLTPNDFFDHFCKILYEYDIIRLDPKQFNVSLLQLFGNSKVKRNIESAFHDLKCHGESIGELIHHIIRDGNSFNLGNLKSKEIKEVVFRLKSIGLVPTIEGTQITKLVFDKLR